MPASTVQQVSTETRSAGVLFARLLPPLVLALVALLTFFIYPGHTFLESDSQIFMPVLLHRMDPSLYGQDILISGVHTMYTVWDEMALAGTRLTGADPETILFALQILFRFAGLLGVFWLLESLIANRWLALAGTSVYAAGSWVLGPSLLTVEYEPVPRAFALPFVLLGLGLIAREKHIAAGLAGAFAFLLHPPTALAFWAVYLVSAFFHTEDFERWYGLALLPAAGLVLQAFAWMEPVPAEMQAFFTRIGPAWEKLQHIRAPYVFPSDWPLMTLWLYAVLTLLLALSYRALRLAAAPRLRIFLWMLPAIGLASVPFTWLLLEKLKWSLIPQIQPMRYTLYLVLFGILFGYAMGAVRCCRDGRYLEGALWFLAALSIGFQTNNLFWLAPLVAGAALLPRKPLAGVAAGLPFAIAIVLVKPFGFALWTAANLRVLIACVALAILLAVAAYAARRWPGAAPVAALVAVAAIFLVLPQVGRKASRDIHSPELRALSGWARQQTPVSAVFLFPDAGRGLEPGVFRYYARRSIYVDWKGGGQVNYFRTFAEDWWQRWQAVMEGGYSTGRWRDYHRVGIEYLVFKKLPATPPGPVVYRNQSYSVVAVRPR